MSGLAATHPLKLKHRIEAVRDLLISPAAGSLYPG